MGYKRDMIWCNINLVVIYLDYKKITPNQLSNRWYLLLCDDKYYSDILAIDSYFLTALHSVKTFK